MYQRNILRTLNPALAGTQVVLLNGARQVRPHANIEGLYDMPRLLSLLAARASSLLNMAEVSRATGIAHSTLRRYLTLLEALFILQPLPAW